MTQLVKDKLTAYNIPWTKLASIAKEDITTLDIARLQATVADNAPTHYPARDIKVLLSHLYKNKISL